MEIYSSTTRFALACNISSKIIEPIQSRCAILRYTRLSDKQVLQRLMEICAMQQVSFVSMSFQNSALIFILLWWLSSYQNFFVGKVTYTPEGLEALIFTAEGDMRQAINNLQSTYAGFGLVSEEHVFKVCDQPHPRLMQSMIQHCMNGEADKALDELKAVWEMGYSVIDIITTVFRVVKYFDSMPELMKLEYVKVRLHGRLLNWSLRW